MKRLLGSWKFYIGIIVLGFTLWAVPEMIDLLKIKSTLGFYQEAKILGQLLVGIGGVGSSAKLIADLFRRKKKDE